MCPKILTLCNWTQTGGNTLNQALPVRTAAEDVFEKPELGELLSEEGSVLFNRPEANSESCELEIQIFPSYKIVAVSLVCTVPKIEIFVGSYKEYIETILGCIIDDNCGTDVADDEIIPASYRYDFGIKRSGTVNLSMKLLTSEDEICIFGTILYIAPNPNASTTLLAKSINLENVHDMLKSSNQRLSGNTEKYIQLMEIIKTKKDLREQDAGHIAMDEVKINSDSSLKSHIDRKFDELQRDIFKRLETFEAQQSAKLDKILELIKNKF